MRNKDRIKPMVELLENAWRLNPTMCFYELLWRVYHDDEEQWQLYYKEDDFWKDNIVDTFSINYEKFLEDATILSDTQRKLILIFKMLWDRNYDLRFPQICNVVYDIVGDNVSDENMLNILIQKVGDLDGNR